MVSDKGGKKGYVVRTRWKAYRKLRKKGMPKSIAAAISNEGRTFAGRSMMARKAAKTRKAKSGGRKQK